MVEYITMNGLWYVFLQDSLIFLVVCFFSEIKEKKKVLLLVNNNGCNTYYIVCPNQFTSDRIRLVN